MPQVWAFVSPRLFQTQVICLSRNMGGRRKAVTVCVRCLLGCELGLLAWVVGSGGWVGCWACIIGVAGCFCFCFLSELWGLWARLVGFIRVRRFAFCVWWACGLGVSA